jgi:tryptophan synthase beta chain
MSIRFWTRWAAREIPDFCHAFGRRVWLFCRAMAPIQSPLPDAAGHYGQFGGMFVPETLMTPLQDLTVAYEAARRDPAFQSELDGLLADYVGRPSPLYFAERWTELCGGAKIYLKREDLMHTGAHKINNALGQILLAKRLGKRRIIAETGAG